MTKAKSALVGRWRIVEADLWDRDFLDLCGPATLVVGSEGHGEDQLRRRASRSRHRLQP